MCARIIMLGLGHKHSPRRARWVPSAPRIPNPTTILNDRAAHILYKQASKLGTEQSLLVVHHTSLSRV